MKQMHLADYRVIPSVVVRDVPTTVTIQPQGTHAAFADGVEYGVELWPAMETTHVIGRCAVVHLRVTAANGCLKFTHAFAGEQQYTIKIRVPEEWQYRTNPHYNPPYREDRRPKTGVNRAPVLYMFSVNEEWRGLTVHKGDFHLHTDRSDGHESPAVLIANLRRAGYDFAAVTDHYVYEPSREAAAAVAVLPDVFTVLPGEEVHLPTEFIHEVSVGASASVNDLYYNNKEACDAEIAALEVSLDIPEGLNRRNYAARYWIAEKSKEFGGMPIHTHTHWLWNTVYFVPEELARFLFEHGNYEAYELLNGPVETNTLHTAFYYDEMARGYTMPIVGDSDSHATDGQPDDHPTYSYTLVLSKERTWDSLHEAILARRSVAVEHYHDDKNFHIFGDYRLVKYMNFLLRNYYPIYQNLCHAQGMLMKEYFLTRDTSLLPVLERLKEQTDTFSQNFFGW